MQLLKDIFSRYKHILTNKFFIASVFFVLWVSFFDENNLIERRQLIKELKQLDKDKVYYKAQIEKDAARLLELQNNDNNSLEKFAREQYLMKRDDEDLFIIVEK